MEDSYAKIKLAANHNQLILVKTQPLSAGNANSVFIEFILRTDDWGMCDKIKAVFNNYYVRDITNKLVCDIPAEVLAYPGQFEVGIYGITASSRIVTNKIEFHVGEGTNVNGYEFPEYGDHLIIYDGGGVDGY